MSDGFSIDVPLMYETGRLPIQLSMDFLCAFVCSRGFPIDPSRVYFRSFTNTHSKDRCSKPTNYRYIARLIFMVLSCAAAVFRSINVGFIFNRLPIHIQEIFDRYSMMCQPFLLVLCTDEFTTIEFG